MKGKVSTLATIAILCMAAVYFIPGPALACFNPTDSFATEVLLNKPGISYDLSEISQAQSVTIITAAAEPVLEEEEVLDSGAQGSGQGNEAETVISDIIYRSHYDPEIAVILSEGSLYGSEDEYLSVKIQIPTKSVSYTVWNVDMSLTKPVDTSSLNIEPAKALGWEISGSGGDWPYYKGMKDNITVNIFPRQLEEPEEMVIIVSISNTTVPLGEQTKEEIAALLVAIGFAGDKESALENAEIESTSSEWQDLAPATDIDPEEFDWNKAMRTELLWLRDNGVIRGLADSDIDEASSACERGTAGHNSRIVFEDGEWMPYHKTGNPVLLRAGDCGGFSIDALPDGVLESTGADANDGNPSSMTYVWAIVGAVIAVGAGTLIWHKRAKSHPIR